MGPQTEDPTRAARSDLHKYYADRARFAVDSTLFHRATMPARVGRQMQTWVGFPDGWLVVAAHVSVNGEA
jgi:hypothetical protein